MCATKYQTGYYCRNWYSVANKHSVNSDGLDEDWLNEMLNQPELNPNLTEATARRDTFCARN